MSNRNRLHGLPDPEQIYAEYVAPATYGDAQRQHILDGALTMADEARRGELELDAVLGLHVPARSDEVERGALQETHQKTVVVAAGLLLAGAYKQNSIFAQAGRNGDTTSQQAVGRAIILRGQLRSPSERRDQVAVAVVDLASRVYNELHPVRPGIRGRFGRRTGAEQPVNHSLLQQTLQREFLRMPTKDPADRARRRAIAEELRILPLVVPAGKLGENILIPFAKK